MKLNNVFGWDSENDVALDIYQSAYRDLLLGPLLFAYKNTKKTGTVSMVIVTKRLNTDYFRMYYLPLGSGWTEYNPVCSKKYLLEVILKDLESNKTDKEIVKNFINNIEIYG